MGWKMSIVQCSDTGLVNYACFGLIMCPSKTCKNSFNKDMWFALLHRHKKMTEAVVGHWNSSFLYFCVISVVNCSWSGSYYAHMCPFK